MGEREALTTYTYTSTSGIELIETPAGLLVSKLEANNAGAMCAVNATHDCSTAHLNLGLTHLFVWVCAVGRSAYAAGVELGDRLVSFGQHPLPLYHREQILFIEKDLHTKNLQRTMRFSKRLPLIPELKHLSSCAVTPTVESLERQVSSRASLRAHLMDLTNDSVVPSTGELPCCVESLVLRSHKRLG
jgi:hypothetical protein